MITPPFNVTLEVFAERLKFCKQCPEATLIGNEVILCNPCGGCEMQCKAHFTVADCPRDYWQGELKTCEPRVY